MKVIGVIGLNGSGKDEVVNYLNKQYSVPLFSAGDVVRGIAKEEGVEPTRDNLDLITKRYFARYGEGYFLKLLAERIKRSPNKNAGISGIRSPRDVQILKDAFGSYLVLVHVYVSDPEVRYGRTVKRGAVRDSQSYQEFIRQDQASQEIFHIGEAIRAADYSISNDGSLEDLHREVERLIKEKGLLG
jgi:dephospho-CoA kinase